MDPRVEPEDDRELQRMAPQNKPVVPFSTLLKTLTIVGAPALLVLATYAVFGDLEFSYFVYGYLAVMVVSALFVIPFLSNISALTHYVNDLAQDMRARPPNLSFLSNVGELSGSLGRLQRSWEN